MSQRTPFHDWHVAQGARMVDFAGWDMPVQYTSIVEEHQAVRTGAGLFDISHMGRLVIRGPNALDFIQQVYTNDAASLKPGQIRYGLVCSDDGGILDDVLVYRLEPFWMMVVNASNREKIVRWLARHRAGRDVQVEDVTTRWAMLAVQGPRALDVLTPLWSGAGDLKYYHGKALTGEVGAAGETPAIVSRTGYTGEDGFEVIDVADRPGSLLARILACCEASRGLRLRPCGLGARDTLRLEAAMPLYGHELGEEIDPFQAGLGWAVKLAKGEFLGRVALLKRRQNKGTRQRVGLELEGKRIAREGAVVYQSDKEVGRVTSGTFSPTLHKAIAMAYVSPACTGPGTALDVDIRGKTASGRVVPLPFYRRPQ